MVSDLLPGAATVPYIVAKIVRSKFCCARWGTCLCRLVNHALGKKPMTDSMWGTSRCILTQLCNACNPRRVARFLHPNQSGKIYQYCSENANRFIVPHGISSFIFLFSGLEKSTYIVLGDHPIYMMLLLAQQTLQDNQIKSNPWYRFQTYSNLNFWTILIWSF